jgi:DNA-binding transcriptional LysR family regulator
MDLRQIRQFIAVAEHLSFRKAAGSLHMSQPPLSVSIKQLEQDLGVALFERSRSGVQLTSAGQLILDDAMQLDLLARRLREKAKSAMLGLTGRLRIGFVGSATYNLMPRILPAFRRQYPQVTLELVESTTSAILTNLENGSLDIGLIRYPVLESTQLFLRPVQWDELVLAVHNSHPLLSLKNVHLHDLESEPFIMYSSAAANSLRTLIVFACQSVGFVPIIAQEAIQIQTVISLVESGFGIALVPSISQYFRSRTVTFIRIAGENEMLKVAIAIAIDKKFASPTAQEFRRFLEGWKDNEPSESEL